MFNIFNRKKKQPKIVVPDYIVFSVENFNNWFNSPKESYANSGIFLRLDKFSPSFIKDYMIECYGYDMDSYQYIKIIEFQDKIKKDWRDKLSKQ